MKILFILILFLFVSITISEKEKNKEDKSINEIINKGYNKHIESLKLKNQYHYNEEKYLNSAKLKQINNPTGYKCQHDTIIEKRKIKIQERIKSKLSSGANAGAGSSDTKLGVSNNGDNVVAAASTKPSVPIRFTFDTSYITGTNDKYACHSVGQVIPIDATKAEDTCEGDGSVSPCLYTCKAIDVQTAALQDFYKNTILETIKEIFNSRLYVRDPKDKIVFNELVNDGVCDYGVNVPPSFFTTGIDDTDIIVWVTSRPTSSNNTIAYAFACNYDVITSTDPKYILGRPTGASINFNPMFFAPFIGAENSISFNEYVRVGIHEMTHSLGFSSQFYESFVTQTANNIVIRDGKGAAGEVQIEGETPSGKSYTIDKKGIFSENVVTFARGHYNCSGITYQELEDFGGTGTAGSHWESRTANEEYMIGFVSPTMPITDLSFSLLKDTGWYDIDSSKNEPFEWGRSLGCDFVQKPCSPTTWNYQGYFCTSNGVRGCTGTREGKGICRIVEGTNSWPPQYQHFKNPKLIGSNLAADGCPFYQVGEDNNVYCFDTSKQSTANSGIYETYCENCKCFEYQGTDNSINQACWEQRCQDNSLQIKINSDWVDCPDSTTVISNGVTIVCPKGYTLCGQSAKAVNISNTPTNIPVQTTNQPYDSNSGGSSTIIIDGNDSSILLPTFVFSTIVALLITIHLIIK